jgi:hypothetical protein
MNFENEELGGMMREVASGWPSDRFIRELRTRRWIERNAWKLGLVTVAVAAFVGSISWSIASNSARLDHPHGQVLVGSHQCDAGDDVTASFRAALEAEALGDSRCAARNFARVVSLAEPEHRGCSVVDHPVDAQVAIARWELARAAARK